MRLNRSYMELFEIAVTIAAISIAGVSFVLLIHIIVE